LLSLGWAIPLVGAVIFYNCAAFAGRLRSRIMGRAPAPAPAPASTSTSCASGLVTNRWASGVTV
jgi:hypothetical protein